MACSSGWLGKPNENLLLWLAETTTRPEDLFLWLAETTTRRPAPVAGKDNKTKTHVAGRDNHTDRRLVAGKDNHAARGPSPVVGRDKIARV